MPEHHPLEPASPWVEVVATEADWDAADPALLRTIYAQLVWIRAFEQYVLDLAAAGLIHGPAHSSIGQEGGAVGSVLALTSADSVNGSHRGHHQFLAKALHHVEPKGMDPLAGPSDEVREVLLRTLAEICGLDRGWTHGRGGSMHLQWKEAGAMGTNAIVGGGVPQAAGFAWSHRQAGTDAVSVTYFGDGAVNIGSTLESMNLGRRLGPPGLLLHREQPVRRLHQRRRGHRRAAALRPRPGLQHRQLEGRRDGPAGGPPRDERGRRAHAARGRARRSSRSTPTGSSTRTAASPAAPSATGTKEEESSWRDRDPLTQTAGHLVRRGIMTAEETAARRSTRAKAVMEEVGQVLLEPVPDGKPGQRRIKADEWPDPAWVDVGVRGDLSEFDDAPLVPTRATPSRCGRPSSSTRWPA